MELIDNVNSVWIRIMNAADSRVDDKFMMNSPVSTIIMVAGYIYFVKVKEIIRK